MIGPPDSRAWALLLVLILAGPVKPSAQDIGETSRRYYISNELGMALEEIGWYRQEEFPYILVVVLEGGGERRTLIHEGEELRRWELDPREERTYLGPELEQRRRYDQQGRLTEEQRFADGELSERTVYHYSRELLERTETFGPEGELLHRDVYRLSPDGQLRRVSREGGDNQSGQQLALSGGSAGIAEERYGNTDQRRVNRYDPKGRLVEQEYWYEGELTERERFEYRGESENLLSSQLEELPPGRRTRRSYDEEGRIVGIEVQQPGGQEELTVHLRDEQGRIVETTIRGSRGIEKWLFEYGPEDDLVREEYRLRGSLERITLYSGQGQERTRVEELYREGRPFMRIHYEAEQKVKEEFLRDGEIVRVREFE